MTSTKTLGITTVTAIVVLGVACGGNTDDPELLCEGGTVASTDSYLPFSVGNVWRYQVTDVATSDVTIKRQELREEMTPPDETEPVILQVTVKSTGTTESWLRVRGDATVRIQQQDFDAQGLLEQTTRYVPHKLRLDEAAERVADGAVYQDIYSRVVTDPVGTELSNVEIVDEWRVLGVDVPCAVDGFGETECLHVSRRRLAGGIADKEFFFARGYGKIREIGGQLEELIECSLE